MHQVQRSPRKPLVPRKACPAPGEVLFKRSVCVSGVAPEGDRTTKSLVGLELGISPMGQRFSRVTVSSVLSRLRLRRVELVASKSQSRSDVASASEHPVAPASRPAASGPRSTLTRVLDGLRRSGIAAKVQRGRRRLSRMWGPRQSSRIAGPGSVAFALVQSASQSVPSASVASAALRASSRSVRGLH